LDTNIYTQKQTANKRDDNAIACFSSTIACQFQEPNSAKKKREAEAERQVMTTTNIVDRPLSKGKKQVGFTQRELR